MTTRPPHKVSIPAAIQKEVFVHLDGLFAPGIRDPNSHVEWSTLRAQGYRSFVAMACFLHFGLVLFALFSFFELRVDDYPDLISGMAVFAVFGLAIVAWNHRMVYRFFMFRAGIRTRG